MSRTSTKHWLAVTRQIRSEGKKHNLPCHLCAGSMGPIDYRTQGEVDREARQAGRYWEKGAHRPLALSVDHIVPHAAGGQDTIENAAPAHTVCNSRAGSKGTRQPRNKPVNGLWWPNSGEGEPLPSRALPGARTPTHTFKPC